MKKVLVVVVFGLISSTCFCQIETDRPDFTESPNVVPKGGFQVETGFILENDKTEVGFISNEDRVITLNTTLLRYGLTDRVELRLNWNASSTNNVIRNTLLMAPSDVIYDTTINGLSPVFVGTKVNLYQNDRISIGMLSHIYLPWASSENSRARFIAPEVLLPMSIDITDRFGIALQYGLTWDGETPNPTTSYTLALGYSITDALSFYVEPYGFLTNSGDELHLINGGFTYLVNDNFLLDLTGGFGLNELAPDNFINTGASFLINKK